MPTKAPKTRPTTARKVTRKTEENRAAAHNRGLQVKVGGQAYEVRLGDITPAMAHELRMKVGFGPAQLIAAVVTAPDIDVVSAFVWLSRRIDGEKVAFGDVSITYDELFAEDFDFDPVENAPEDDASDPEG